MAAVLVNNATYRSTIKILELPSGNEIRSFGDEPGDVSVCFAADNHLLIANGTEKRVGEVTLEGKHVDYIGVDVLRGACISIAANRDVIVLGVVGSDSSTVPVFDAWSRDWVRDIRVDGRQKTVGCVEIMPDGQHVITCDRFNSTLCMFKITGEFVRCIGVGCDHLNSPQFMCCVSGGRELLVTVGMTKAFVVFSIASGEYLRTVDCEFVSALDGDSFMPNCVSSWSDKLFASGRFNTRCMCVFD
jgi:WD40 repeat protein